MRLLLKGRLVTCCSAGLNRWSETKKNRPGQAAYGEAKVEPGAPGEWVWAGSRGSWGTRPFHGSEFQKTIRTPGESGWLKRMMVEKN